MQYVRIMVTAKEESFLVRLFSIEMLIAIVFFAIALSIFMFIADYIVIDQKDLFDSRMFAFMEQFRSPRNNQIALFITTLATFNVLIPVYAVVLGYLIYIKKRRYAVMVGVIVTLSVLLGFLLKEIFHRERPLFEHLDPVIGYSFPSGHTLAAFTFSGVMIYLVWNTKLRAYAKVLWTLFLFVLAVCIGLSRIYLHVHFASDVLGGFCVTVVWLSMCFIGIQYARQRRWMNAAGSAVQPGTTI